MRYMSLYGRKGWCQAPILKFLFSNQGKKGLKGLQVQIGFLISYRVCLYGLTSRVLGLYMVAGVHEHIDRSFQVFLDTSGAATIF
jgi:hypothetical protein